MPTTAPPASAQSAEARVDSLPRLLPLEEKVGVTLRIPVAQLDFVGRNDRYVVEPGDFELYAGAARRRSPPSRTARRVR